VPPPELRSAAPSRPGGAEAVRRGREELRAVRTERETPAPWEAGHREKVERVATALRERRSSAKVSLQKRAPRHEVPKARDLRYSDEKIDVSALDEILEIDGERRTCVAEPGVTFEDLVAATLRHGLVPAVVPELKTITIGGAVAGCSLESSSFRVGGFHDSCLEYEVITGRGEILACERDGANARVFEMMHGTFGTLGILSRLTFRLVPAKPFVKVVYERHASCEAYAAAIQRHFEAADADFVDGIIHSPREWILSVGRFVDEAPYTHAYDWTRVYFRSTRERTEDYLRTPDYFFRYDHGVTTVRPRTFVGRLLFGKMLGSTQILTIANRLHRLMGTEHPMVTVDLFLPFSRFGDFMNWYTREVNHFPLWCVPYRVVRPYAWLSDRFVSEIRDALFLDLAVYGMHQPRGVNVYRLFEEELLELGGVKTLISNNYYTEDEFWRTWNRDRYAEAKARTDPDNVFRDLYEKTCLATRGLER
jgi:FAD/FMN-containing dehydrogenase